MIPTEILLLTNLNKFYNRKSIKSKNFEGVKRSRKYHYLWDYLLKSLFSNKSLSI